VTLNHYNRHEHDRTLHSCVLSRSDRIAAGAALSTRHTQNKYESGLVDSESESICELVDSECESKTLLPERLIVVVSVSVFVLLC
jgi:hypothetical protein